MQIMWICDMFIFTMGVIIVYENYAFILPPPPPLPPQVFICHDKDTGRDLAVKIVNIDRIPTTESFKMQKVSGTY